MIESRQNIALIRDAIKTHNLDSVKHLIESFPDLKYINTPFGTWLHVAASSGSLDIVKYLIIHGFDPNKKGGTFGGNSLNTAASSGYLDIVEYLLSINVEMDISVPEKNPLFGAIMKSSLPIVEKLIGSGINYKVLYTGDYMNNMDAEALALERGETEIANYLHKLKSI